VARGPVTASRRSKRPGGATYQFGGTFRAPLPFVYRWCLDYAPDDAKLSKEDFVRKIVHRSAGKVVYEDLEEGPTGWRWSHIVVTKRPPDGWHAEITGSHRDWDLDYALHELPEGRTELVAKGRRRPTPLGEPNPPRRELEEELRDMWRNYARALERDFRSEVGPRRRST
jgi:hypothetical protein